MSEWKTIDSAPKNKWIVAYRPESTIGKWDRVVVCRWDSSENSWAFPSEIMDIYEDGLFEEDEDGYMPYDPFHCDEFTHWMPLPSPPVGEND